MSIKIVEEIEVCADCLQAIANDDYTSLDYYYGASAAEREQEIRDGINRLTDGRRSLAAVGDPAGFKWRNCECCDGDTGGARWTVAVLESVPPNQQFVISAGAVKCTYTAESEAAALELYAEDAGYSSYAKLVEGHGTVDSIRKQQHTHTQASKKQVPVKAPIFLYMLSTVSGGVIVKLEGVIVTCDKQTVATVTRDTLTYMYDSL